MESSVVSKQDGSIVPAPSRVYEPSAGVSESYFLMVTPDGSGGRPIIKFADINAIETRWVEWASWKNFQIDTLVMVIKVQRRLFDYNAHYNAFLLQQITEEEFEEISSQFVYEPKTYDEKELSARIVYLGQLAEVDFSVSELAEIFQCDYESIKKTISLLNHDISDKYLKS